MFRERELFSCRVLRQDWSQGHLMPPPSWHGAGEGTRTQMLKIRHMCVKMGTHSPRTEPPMQMLGILMCLELGEAGCMVKKSPARP